MGRMCLICKESYRESIAPFLCFPCGYVFEGIPNREERFQSLYRYNKILRTLILDVKIHGNYRALECLKHLFISSSTSQELASRCETLVPAPSSLWSRVRGRFDLAYFLSLALAQKMGRKMENAPLQLRWEFNKRSKMSSRNKITWESREMDDAEKILIIDDVVTSGHTLHRAASVFQEKACHFLTLASAFHSHGWNS